MTVIDKDHGWLRIKQEAMKAHGLEVAVGIQEGSTNGEGANIAEYGTYNEFGTKDIPSRPFMATTFDENQTGITGVIARRYNALLDGKFTAHQALLSVGEFVSLKIKNTISKRDFLPRLSPSTVKAKKGNSTKTLVDTGAMLNSIRPVVRKRGS